MRGLSGELVLKEIKDIEIHPVAVPRGSRTATASVTFTFIDEDGTDQMQLKEVDGSWKIVWEQAQTMGDGGGS